MLLAQPSERPDLLDGLDPRLRVALLDERQHQLLEHSRLALGSVLVRAQVAGFEAVSQEAGHELGDEQRIAVVHDLAPTEETPGDETVLLDVTQLLDRQPARPASSSKLKLTSESA